MPLILVAPLAVVAVIAVGVRSRRWTGNLALLAPLLAGLGTALAGAAQLHRSAPYDGSYEWLNISTASSGPARFQTYITDVGIRVDHLNTLLLGCAVVVALAVVAWSRVGARGEPSPARYYGLLTLLLGATIGVIVSTDLGELYAFWGVAAVAAYLLRSNAWGDPETTGAGRLALAIPAVADLSLLAGIALLYSRYGQLNIDQLIPGIQSLGPQPKTLTVATLLILAGAAGRLGLFPFQGWLTEAGEAGAGAQAAVQGYWTLIVAALLAKVLPIVVSADLLDHYLPGRAIAVTAALSAVLLPLLGLASRDARKAVTASGIAVAALGFLAFAEPGAVGPATLLLAAGALARAAATLAIGALAAGMRTRLVTEMGEGYRRMRLSAVALPLAALALFAGFGAIAGAGTLRWYWAVAYGLGAGLAALGLLRVYLLAGHSLLPRRRGFDPNRVRPAPPEVAYPPLGLGIVSLALGIAFYVTGFFGWADNHPHPVAGAAAHFWLAAPLAGALVAAVLFYWSRETGGRLTGAAADAWDAISLRLRAGTGRLLVDPALEVAALAEEEVVGGAEEGLAGWAEAAAGLARRSLPVLPILVGAALLLAAVAGLVAPGVYR